MGEEVVSAKPPSEELGRSLAILAAVGLAPFIAYVFVEMRMPLLAILEKEAAAHPAAFFGIPLSGIVAWIIVGILRQPKDPIVFKAPGIEVSGTTGQVALWFVCFFAMIVAIKLLW